MEAAVSSKKLSPHSATELERQSRLIGAPPVDDAAIDRILATIDLAGTSAILAPGVEASTLDAAHAAKIKRLSWSGQVRSMLSFLTAMVRRRKLSTAKARKKLTKAVKGTV